MFKRWIVKIGAGSVVCSDMPDEELWVAIRKVYKKNIK